MNGPGDDGKLHTDRADECRSALAQGKRVAAAATVLTLLLALLKGGIGYVRHSPALTADAVHSAADTLAIIASWVGLKFAERPPNKRFPFGLYRAETLASLAVAVVITVAGLELLKESSLAAIKGNRPAHHSVEVLLAALVSAIVSAGIFVWEKRVGQRLNSQSLLANADESRMDIATSLAVFAGAGATYAGFPVAELGVSILLSLLIIWIGLKHGRLALYALLDASLDPEMEERAVRIAKQVAGVMDVTQIRLRRAGPFCFGVVHVQLRRSIDVGRAHEVAHQVVRAVRNELPQIETLTVHVEPHQSKVQTVMVPATADSPDADVSEHFGRARFFVFAEVSSAGISDVEYVENAIREASVRAGLQAIRKNLDERNVDVVITRGIGEIAFHALREHYVDVCTVTGGSVWGALTAFGEGSLLRLEKPTHNSEGPLGHEGPPPQGS
jgi:cation diffusion facilitator family transporter